jgi:hypothetical protein
MVEGPPVPPAREEVSNSLLLRSSENYLVVNVAGKGEEGLVM